MLIERNYHKHPHTASFLQTFHTATTERQRRANAEAAMTEDLFDSPALDRRSPAQSALMTKLITELTTLDSEAGAAAADWTRRMTEHGKWTPGRDGNASDWISRLIARIKASRSVAVAPATATPHAVPAGRYAITDGEIKCYKVSHGKGQWAGTVFLERISSDDRYPIRSAAERERILAAIAADVEAAAVLAAHTLRQCRRCGRTLSDTKNPYFPAGLGPDCGAM